VVQEFGADSGMYSGSAAHPRPIVAILGVEHLNAMFWRPPQNRMLARNALVLLLATATATQNDSQSANSIMPGCNAWLAQLSRGSTALGSNVFLAGECMGIVGTILYISHATFPFHQRPARLRT
jgi:hypothetical protein